MSLLLLLFIIITLLLLINVCLFTYDRYKRPVEIDCFDLADKNEFALSDFNDEVNEVQQGTAIEDLVEMMTTNDDRDVFADECTENNIENDLPHTDSEGEVNEVVDAVLDNGLDDYQSGDDSGCEGVCNKECIQIRKSKE